MGADQKNEVVRLVNRWDRSLEKYVETPGDSQETLSQKKLWLILTSVGLPWLIVMSILIADKQGMAVLYINVFFGLAMFVSLLLFHFQKAHIERFILFIQVLILSLTTIKVYLMGGLLEAGGAIFIGLIAPLYALTTNNRRRAVIFFAAYLVGMIVATELQPNTNHDYFQYYYYMGFILGISIAFLGLYYYTGRLQWLKTREKMRMKEVDRLKSNFFTHITHELRTPLTIILGMAEQIKEDPRRHLDEGLNMIERNGEKLLDMTNKLLDLSRMEAKMMPVNWVQQDVVAYVKYLVESFHSYAASKQIKISYSIAEKHLMMDFDMDKLADIVSNLISNAIKFTPRGGEIRVDMFRRNDHGNKYLHLRVEDNGPGIEEEFLPKVFERYFQAQRHEDEYSEGSGLGLAVTREMAHLLNGEISVSSELGKGSVFEVILPVTNKAKIIPSDWDADQSVPEVNTDLRNSTPFDEDFGMPDGDEDRKLNLLIVEDSKDVASYLGSLLSVNYKIDNAWNGAEGFELATRHVPDLIISDVMMPVMDGFALCQRLKNDIRTSHIPIILLTARNELSSRMQGLKAGADAYLGKPFNKEELFIRVDQLIALRQRLRNSYQHLAQDPAIFSSEMQIQEKDEPETNSLEYAFMQKVTEILEENLSDEEFGIGNLCDSLGMSRSQLYRKFSALTDTSVNAFIQNLRLTKARKLLRSTDLNVSEVAYDTGFKSPSHFSRVYSNKFGVSPSQERRGIVAASN